MEEETNIVISMNLKKEKKEMKLFLNIEPGGGYKPLSRIIGGFTEK